MHPTTTIAALILAGLATACLGYAIGSDPLRWLGVGLGLVGGGLIFLHGDPYEP